MKDLRRVPHLYVFAGTLAVVVVTALYVGWGADSMLPHDIGSVQTRERIRLVFAGFAALTAPLALWVALTAYRLNARLAAMQLHAQFDVVPDTTEHRQDKETVRFPVLAGITVTTDVEHTRALYTDDPAGQQLDRLYCAIPLINHGAGTAQMLRAKATVAGKDFGPSRFSRSIVRQKEVVFVLLVSGDDVPQESLRLERQKGHGPIVTITYNNVSGDQVAEVTVCLSLDRTTHTWFVDDQPRAVAA